MAKSYYDILGVSKDATTDQIRKAFKKLSVKYHPDKHINDSEEVVIDRLPPFPHQRKDFLGHNGLAKTNLVCQKNSGTRMLLIGKKADDSIGCSLLKIHCCHYRV